MEENTSGSSSSSGNRLIPIIAVVVLLVVGAGGYLFYSQHSSKNEEANEYAQKNVMGANTRGEGQERMGMQVSSMPSNSMMGSQSGGMKMGMQPMPSPTLSAQQKDELAAGPSTSTTAKTFHISGGNFFFVPNKITVNKGDKVTIFFDNIGGFHNWMLDEFNAKTDTIQTGASQSITFTADKAGSFTYYCSIGKHKQLGMEGTLTVQ